MEIKRIHVFAIMNQRNDAGTIRALLLAVWVMTDDCRETSGLSAALAQPPEEVAIL